MFINKRKEEKNVKYNNNIINNYIKSSNFICWIFITVCNNRIINAFINADYCFNKLDSRYILNGGNHMTKEEIEQFKKEHNCNTCTRNIDCKIVRRIDGKLTCIEEE